MNSLEQTVRIASRALGRAGLVHAYGHCSARIDDEYFLVSPSVPLGLVKPGDPCTLVPLSGDLPSGVLGEVLLHQQIYSTRPEIGGVVRFMGPNVMTLAAMGRVPEMRHGFATYFAPTVGLWDDIQLVREREKAISAIEAMGNSAGLIMRGNGAVVAGESLEEAVGLAFYLDDACRVELAVLASNLPDPPLIDAMEAKARATKSGRIFERMWDYLTDGDPELSNAPNAKKEAR